MADNKTTAINEAKDAALGSVSFVLSATRSQSLQLKNSSVLAARNVVAVRKQLVTLVSKFNVLHKMVADVSGILRTNADHATKVGRISNIISSGGDAYKQKEAEQEEKPKALDLVKGIGKDVTVAAGSALALAIPFLLSPELRGMVVGFFDSFIEGLGISTEAVSKLKFGLSMAAGILTAFFAVKTIASIASAFTQMQKLAEVLGLAGEAVNAEKTKQDLDKKRLSDASKTADKDIKSSKKDLKKGKKLGRTAISKKWSLLSKIVGPKLLRVGSNFLKAIPGLGTIISIGLILYDLIDIGKDVYDMFVGSPDDKDTEQETESKAGIAATEEDYAKLAAPNPKSAMVEDKPTASNTSSPSPTTESVPAPIQAEPSTPPAADGVLLKQSSIAVERADTDLAQTAGGISIVAVDNSTTIISNQKANILTSPSFYSVTVGA